MFNQVGLVGATGAVGQIIRELLEKRNFPAKSYRFLASKRTAGTTIEFLGKSHTVEELTKDCFAGLDLVIASTPDDVARDYLPAAIEAGAKVVDESGYWRMNPEVALVIPEINPEAALNAKGIISSPNCSTTQMVLALKPLQNISRIKRVLVSTYQATSGAGLAGSEELVASTQAAINGEDFEAKTFQYPIGFNAIPQIGGHKEQGYTSEEMKMVYETRKILGDEEIQVCPTCVRIPVSNCHSESIIVETEQEITPEQAREAFAAFPGLTVVDDLDAKQYPMPSSSTGSDETYIGRIRKDISAPNSLAFWCVSDNLRKGAATNAVQVAELLAKNIG